MQESPMSDVPSTMTAIVAPTPGGPESLTRVERPVPRPGHGEVLIKVAAAGLNGADLSQRRGRYEMPPGASDILGLEAAGTVVGVGEGVTQWKTGDQVCALLVGGGGVDVILEMVGGDYLQRGMGVLAFGGRLAIIALKNGSKLEFDFSVFQRKDAKMMGSRLRPRPIPEKARLVAAVRKAVWPLIEEGRVKPVVDRTFRLADAAQAHAYMESGAHIGKILLTT